VRRARSFRFASTMRPPIFILRPPISSLFTTLNSQSPVLRVGTDSLRDPAGESERFRRHLKTHLFARHYRHERTEDVTVSWNCATEVAICLHLLSDGPTVRAARVDAGHIFAADMV